MKKRYKIDGRKVAGFLSLIGGCMLLGCFVKSATFGLGLIFVLFPFINNYKSGEFD